MVKESVLLMELAIVSLCFTERLVWVNLEKIVINIKFILKLTYFISNFFIAVCHYLLTCSDHGSCSDVGTCQCDEGFYGDNCSSKLLNLQLVFSVYWPKLFELQLKIILQPLQLNIIKIKNNFKEMITLFLLFNLFQKRYWYDLFHQPNWNSITIVAT